MEIVLSVPDNRVEFMLELLDSINFVSNVRTKPTRSRKAKAAGEEMDTTEYLLSSEANAASLRRSIQQLERGEIVRVVIPDDEK